MAPGPPSVPCGAADWPGGHSCWARPASEKVPGGFQVPNQHSLPLCLGARAGHWAGLPRPPASARASERQPQQQPQPSLCSLRQAPGAPPAGPLGDLACLLRDPASPGRGPALGLGLLQDSKADPPLLAEGASRLRPPPSKPATASDRPLWLWGLARVAAGLPASAMADCCCARRRRGKNGFVTCRATNWGFAGTFSS